MKLLVSEIAFNKVAVTVNECLVDPSEFLLGRKPDFHHSPRPVWGSLTDNLFLLRPELELDKRDLAILS